MPCDYSKYPTDWKDQRRQILDQAGHCCEFCGAENYSRRDGKRIVLTIAHLRHQVETWPVWPDELRALCQRCHNRWDAPYRAHNRQQKGHKQ